MTDIGPNDILFMGQGFFAPAWYRCILPAMALQSDWVGFAQGPPNFEYATGLVRKEIKPPNFDDYAIIIVQHPHGPNWDRWITQQRDAGRVVLYELDDDVWSASKMKHHGKHRQIRNKLRAMEATMRACDGGIASTGFLRGRMARFIDKDKIFVCPAGIDFERYQLERDRNDDGVTTFGFGGGYGHEISMQPWIEGLQLTLNEWPTQLFSVGVDYTEVFDDNTNVVALPFTQVETWPATMSNFDIMLAPGMDNNFFRAKSQLKWIEASAMGIPTIAYPTPYTELEHGKTGYHAHDRSSFMKAATALLRNPDMAAEMGEEARYAVSERHHIRNAVELWIHAFEAVV